MKTTLLIIAVSAVLGAAAGRMLPVRTPANSPPESASEPLPANPEPVPGEPLPTETAAAMGTPEERKALEAEIAVLREDPRTWSEEEIQRRKSDLLARLAKRNGGDPFAVIDIAQQLARLGPAGWQDALNALTQELTTVRFHSPDQVDAFLDACDGAILEVMKWALTEPTLKDSKEARTLAASALSRHFDQDERIAPLFLKALSTETSREVAELLAGAIPRMFPGPVTPEFAATLPVNRREPPEALLAYFRGMRLSNWTDSEKSQVLGTLASHGSPVIREATAATQSALSAAGTGFAIVWVAPDERAALGGLRPGDVVRSVEGEVPGNEYHLLEILSRVKSGESTILTVWREGQEFELAWAGRPRVDADFRGFAPQPGD